MESTSLTDPLINKSKRESKPPYFPDDEVEVGLVVLAVVVGGGVDVVVGGVDVVVVVVVVDVVICCCLTSNSGFFCMTPSTITRCFKLQLPFGTNNWESSSKTNVQGLSSLGIFFFINSLRIGSFSNLGFSSFGG